MGKKKNKPEIKKNGFFIHSFDIPQKCEKTNYSGEIKKYGTFGHTLGYFHACTRKEKQVTNTFDDFSIKKKSSKIKDPFKVN